MDQRGISQNFKLGFERKTLTQQKIPVAMHEKNFCAAGGKDLQSLHNIAGQRIDVELIVTDPIFEQVTEYVK